MGLVTGYDNDVFISYGHIDNQPFGDPGGGWVDIFHEHLQNFVNVHLGRRTKVWRDKRLTGGEIFSDEIEQQLRSSAVLISVISPAYMQSEWCNRELVGFTKAAQDRGSLRVGNLQRVVKALRLPVEPSVLPPLLDKVLGVQFYRDDPASERARDLLLDPAADARQVFRARVDDVAQYLSRLLGAMATRGAATAAPPAPAADTVFLAWTTGDLSEEREKLRRELEARNYRVVPTGAPPLDAAGVRESILAALREAKIAIHLVGALYGFVPEGEERSIIELQSDEALYQASNSAAARIFWLAPNAEPQDPRLRALVDRLQSPQGGHVRPARQSDHRGPQDPGAGSPEPAEGGAGSRDGSNCPGLSDVRSARPRKRCADAGFPFRPVPGSQASPLRRRFGADPSGALRNAQGVRRRAHFLGQGEGGLAAHHAARPEQGLRTRANRALQGGVPIPR